MFELLIQTQSLLLSYTLYKVFILVILLLSDMIGEVSDDVKDILKLDSIAISSNNNYNNSGDDDDGTDANSILSILLLILQVGLLLEYLPTQAIVNLLSSSSSLLAVNGNFNY